MVNAALHYVIGDLYDTLRSLEYDRDHFFDGCDSPSYGDIGYQTILEEISETAKEIEELEKEASISHATKQAEHKKFENYCKTCPTTHPALYWADMISCIIKETDDKLLAWYRKQYEIEREKYFHPEHTKRPEVTNNG
jgi:hypothetical protein